MMMEEAVHVVRPRGRAEQEDDLGEPPEVNLDDLTNFDHGNNIHVNNKAGGVFALEEKDNKMDKKKREDKTKQEKEEQKRLEKERKKAEQDRKKEEQQRKKEEQERKKQEEKSRKEEKNNSSSQVNHSVTDDDLSSKENMGDNGVNQIDSPDGRGDSSFQKQESKRLKEEEKARRKEEARKEKEAKKEREKEKKQQAANTTQSPPRRRTQSSEMMKCSCQMLEGSIIEMEIERQGFGLDLFEKVCEHINLLERDYFGLYYFDHQNMRTWLEPETRIYKQARIMKGGLNFQFGVKFYPPYPTQLREDMARYQICLQVRKDIASETLPCTFLTQALLGSYTAQSELGDYDLEEHGAGYSYLEAIKFAPEQSTALLDKISELHKTHRNLTPEQAEYHFLENARKLEFYGVEFFNSRDAEQVHVNIKLGISARGLLIYKERRQLNRFAWPQILKMSYSSRIFYITLRPVEFQPYQNVIGFNMENSHAAKNIWWICSGHHTFFRLKDAETLPRSNSLMSFGSKFRYSGRTQHQASHRNVPRSASMLSLGSKSNFTQSGRLQNQRVI